MWRTSGANKHRNQFYFRKRTTSAYIRKRYDSILFFFLLSEFFGNQQKSTGKRDVKKIYMERGILHVKKIDVANGRFDGKFTNKLPLNQIVIYNMCRSVQHEAFTVTILRFFRFHSNHKCTEIYCVDICRIYNVW